LVEPSDADNWGVTLTVVRSAASTDPPGAAGRTRPGPWVLVAVGVAVVLPLASVPVVALPPWALRWSLLPALAGLGLPALVAAGFGRGDVRWPARWAMAWLAWAAVATVLAPQPVIAFWGEYRVGTGLVFLAAVAGAWAIGARAGARAARPVATALLVVCAVNAAIGAAAQLFDLSAYGVEPLYGRAVGLFGNPVYLAELLCGGLWIALTRLIADPTTEAHPRSKVQRRAEVAAGLLIGAGIELSGSRAGLALAVAAGAIAVWQARGRGRLLVAAVLVGGLALGAGIAAISPGSTTGTDRVTTVATADAGIRPRVDTWRAGLSAVASRPLWGWGPSGTLAATGPRRTLAVARNEGPDMMFADTHNLVVEAAVTTGVVGLALLLAWIGSAVVGARRRRTGHGLLGFAALVAGVSLVEPMHVGVTPLIALALGAAGGWEVTVGTGSALRRAAESAGAAIGAVGVATTVWLVAGLIALHQADLAGSPSSAQTAARSLPSWGEPDAVVGRLIAFEGITRRDPALLDDANRWWAAAAARDRADASRWNDLGGALEHAGHADAAVAAYRHALVDNPWSARALSGLVRIGAAGGVNPSEVRGARARLALLPH
jgi:O-antigen ligase